MPTYWRVAVGAPMPEALTYSAPFEIAESLVRGHLVNVPLGKANSLVKGVILGTTDETPKFGLKDISSIDLEYEPLPEPFLKWLEWVADYYLYAPGLVTSLAYPPLRRSVNPRKSLRPEVIPSVEPSFAKQLNSEQKIVFESLSQSQTFSTHLLFGVTGSGKTEVYLQLLENTLKSGKSGLILVPEIALTPQLVDRFAARFGDRVAVLHSQLTDRERTSQWWDIVDKKKSVLIGARSALFCPIDDLGLIVVDEEHEPSYKQDEKLKYHGRDSAVMLGKFWNCPVVLGSATPSLESYKNALDGKYSLHKMTSRVISESLPEIEIVDLRMKAEAKKEREEFGLDLPEWMSVPLYKALDQSLQNQEQAALFLNRRGMAQVTMCPSCGFIAECPNCDISLTLHGKHHLVCHYCDYAEPFKESCTSCKDGELRPIGVGTEQIEEDLQKLFPDARLARADRDEISNRLEMEELIKKMENHEVDFLIGTQMIAKGLDFPKLNTVGLVLADIGFNLPDFRATERSFQLMTQVAGRAGRHVQKGQPNGKVLIQTLNPKHPSIEFALKHDFESFAQQELLERSGLKYPPLGRLISFRLQGTQLDRVQKAAQTMAHRARTLKDQNTRYTNVEILGPAEAAIAKLRGQFRYHLLLKGDQQRVLNGFTRQVVGREDWLPPGVRLLIDVDPVHLL